MKGHASRAAAVAMTAALVGGLLSVGAAAPAGAGSSGPCGPPVTSVIACENTKTGDPPSDWKVAGNGDATIQGYATQISVDVGQTVTFKISASVAYHIDILRLGWYQGNGARIIQSNLQPDAAAPQNVPPVCSSDASTGLVDCGGWAPSAHWNVPASATSGVYEAHLVRNDTGGSSAIVFVVRNDASHSAVVFQTSDETWEAYNTYGGVDSHGASLAGNSLYTCVVNCPAGNPQAYKGAYAVSYNRPLQGLDDSGRSSPFYAEFNMIEYLEANGYDVSYMAGADVESRGSLLLNHKIFTSTGHDEYWSAAQRANVTAARDAGVNLAFFSGNEMFWKTRWAPSIANGMPMRTLVSYKETHFDAPTDPNDPNTWTGSWQDPRFSQPVDGGRPQNAVTGQLFVVNSGTTDIVVPAAYAHLRIWRNTAVAGLSSGSITIGAGVGGTLGYEWDEDADNGSRPAGEFDLSSTTLAGSAEVFTDYGSNTDPNGTATHHLSLYKAPSGALIFGAGSVQFVWALMSPNGNPADVNARQMVVNLFADMGNVQPATLMSGLVAATPSTDTSPPTSVITSPTASASLTDGSQVTITGTASDTGGGVVAGVEVSTDGGSTWHPATGTTSWSYTWIAHGNPATSIRSRAVDDSGNLETAPPSVPVNVGCPCSVLSTNLAPVTADALDANPNELGMRFTPDVSGTVTGIRFYKASTNTGTHVGNLWTASGSNLASVTFTGETTSGWQSMNFGSPVAVTAGTTYVVSYFAPVGHYSRSKSWFYPAPSAPGPDGSGSDVAAPLHPVLAVGGNANGVYASAGASTFPGTATTGPAAGSNYWVDVIFTPTAPGPVAPGGPSDARAVAGNGTATVSWGAPYTGGSPITSYVVTPHVGASSLAPVTVSGSPPATTATIGGLTNGTTYTFTVTATDGIGTGPAAITTGVTPTGPPAAPSSVTAAPGNASAVVSWSTPASGGSPITSYTVTPHSAAGDLPPTTVSGAPPSTSALITGLTNGTTYTFTVVVANGTGAVSVDSAPSAGVVPSNQGAWLVASDGGIFALGSASFHGSTGNIALNKPIVGMAHTADGAGYWLVASDGGIFAFGDAGFYGSTGNLRLNQPVVGMAPTPDGRGYWLVASDGGLFAFGDAGFYGSSGNLRLAQPVVGMSPSPTGHGYRLVASDGGLFSYGDAPFYGSLGGHVLSAPVVGMANTASGQGYRMVQSDGGVDNFGDARVLELPPHGPLARPVVGISDLN